MSIPEKVFMARVADQAERPEDMVDFLKEIVKEKSEDLSVEERNLLSVGFKNLIGARRTAFRTVAAIENNKKYEEYSARCREYKQKIEKELVDICEDIIDLIKKESLNKAEKDEAKAFELQKASAEAGCAFGADGLAGCYAYGWGVEKDGAKAQQWLKRAKELGYCSVGSLPS